MSFGQSRQIDSLKIELDKTSDERTHARVILELSKRLVASNLSEALEVSNRAVKEAMAIKNDTLLMSAYLNEGAIYIQFGNYLRAMQLFQQVIHGSNHLGTNIKAVAYANLGSIYYYQHDHQNALKYYLIALKNYSSIQNTNIMNNVGVIYSETKRYDSALYYYKQCLDIGQKFNQYEAMANVLNNYGMLYSNQNKLQLAQDYYMKALNLRKKHGIRFGIARSYLNIGEFYLKKKHLLDSSIYYLNKSIEISSAIGVLQTMGLAYEYLNAAYEQQGEYKNAFEALKKSKTINDSLFNEESTRKMAQLEMQFEFDKKQNQQEADRKQKEFFFWLETIVLVSLLIIVTLLFVIQRNRTKRSELEQAHLQLEKINLKNDLDIKDKELAANIMYLLNKNELINHLSEKLLEIKKGTPNETQSSIQKVIVDLQTNLQPELWQEFEFRFQQVNEGFYKVLNERFPDLSPSERRLCVFLKLNMTTKEISAITHQNAKSIDVARTRLRKKLNLTGTDQNLVVFLLQLGEQPAESK